MHQLAQQLSQAERRVTRVEVDQPAPLVEAEPGSAARLAALLTDLAGRLR